MALTLIGSAISSLQRGVESAESAMKILNFTVRYFPEVDETHQDNLGETDGMVRSSVASREVTLEGETSGVTAHTFLAASSPANDVADYGSATGGLYMFEAVVTQSRADWRKVSIHLRSHPGLA